MTFDAAYDRLQIALRQPLPGAEAQALMAPRPRRDWPEGFNPAHIRHAAGLLLLFPIEAQAHIVLTGRSDTLGRHGGQISLPGGVAEPGETFEDTALREAHEEVALPPGIVRILGRLTPIDIPVSGFRLHPIVGASATRPPLWPADGEVAGILEVAVADLLESSHLGAITRLRDGREVVAPAFQLGDASVWGATAMVLAEFLTLLGWNPGPAQNAKR
jgi:8-oxo-dGTP pyrophosphatase MutT (NUDIX family)